jgi:hypothetical protein
MKVEYRNLGAVIFFQLLGNMDIERKLTLSSAGRIIAR